MAEKSKIKTKNWRDYSKNHPLRFPFYIFINRRLKFSRIDFFLFPNPQNSAIFSFFFSAVFFAARLNPALGDQKQQSFNFSAKQDIHSLYISVCGIMVSGRVLYLLKSHGTCGCSLCGILRN